MSSAKPSLLLVDDELSMRDSLGRWFAKDGYEVSAAADGPQALAALERRRFDVALVDLKMPGMDGLELQREIRRRDPRAMVIILTAFASVETAVEALKEGAFDYVTKPVDPETLGHVVERALERRRLEEENVHLRQTIDGIVDDDRIVGESPAIRKVMELVRHVAPTNATVLIRGESGTGKELIARAIHAASPRRYRALVPVNCGGLPESLLESELFGVEKGAFTGAEQRRKGRLEMADGGTLFLDEVGAIPAKMQVDLLRVLETKSLLRLGGSKALEVDFRVICATHENLEKAVEAGRFREDFYYRINVFTIEAPTLRERPSDIPLLARHFLARLSHQMNKRYESLSPEAVAVLTAYDWPGNVRELSNAIERAMVVGSPPTIRAEDLPLERPAPRSHDVDTLAEVEKRHIARVLEQVGWNVRRAADVLKVDRGTVYNKMRRYGLRRDGA